MIYADFLFDVGIFLDTAGICFLIFLLLIIHFVNLFDKMACIL